MLSRSFNVENVCEPSTSCTTEEQQTTYKLTYPTNAKDNFHKQKA